MLFTKKFSTPLPLFGIIVFYLVALWQANVQGTHVMQLEDHQFHFLNTGDWLIQFYSNSCPYCARYSLDYDMFAKNVDKIIPELKVAKIDVSTNPGLAARFLVFRVPTLYYIRKGNVYPVPDIEIPFVMNFVKGNWEKSEPWTSWWSPFSLLGMFLGSVGALVKFSRTSPYGFIVWTSPLFVGLGGIYLYIAARPEASEIPVLHASPSKRHVRPSNSKKKE